MKRSNVYIQRDSSTCGACSVASILSYYGGYVPLEVIIEDTKTSKTGTNAFYITKALNSYGFYSYGIKSNIDVLNKRYLPVIAQVCAEGLEHFLVIYDYDEKSVLTMDPKYGKKVYSKVDFKNIFTGIVIIIEPVGKITKMNKRKSLKSLLLREYKNEFNSIFKLNILSIIILLLSIMASMYIKVLNNIRPTILIFCLFVLINLINSLICILKSKLESIISLNFESRVNNKFIRHIFNLELRYLNNKRVGEIIRRINDISYIKDWFLTLVLRTNLDLLTLLITLFISFILFRNLIPVLFLYILLNVLIGLVSSKFLYKKENILLDSYNEFSGNLSEYLEGIESIKNLSYEERIIRKINDNHYEYINMSHKLNRYNDTILNIKNFITSATSIIFTTYAFNSVSLMDLIVFNSIFSITSSSLANIMSLIPIYIHVKTIFNESSEFLDVKEENGGVILNSSFKTLEFKDFSYSYDYLHKTLNNVNFKVNSGDKILIKGASGVGKSTLAKCIAGIYNDYDGHVMLNNFELKDINKSSLRNKVLYVGQNERLFKGMIKENITYGNNNESFEEIADICNLKEIIISKQAGLNSLILEGGSNLSGGERARIILARALYKKPDVLIIDETLSSVSEWQENQILGALLKSDITLIYITHRSKEEYFNHIIDVRKDAIYETIK